MFSLGRRPKAPVDQGALLEWILDKDREVVYSLGADRRFRMVRGASTRLWGYRNEELLGRDFADMVVPRDRRTVLSAFEGHMRGRVAGLQESQFQKRDGSPIRMMWKLADGPLDGSILGEAREFYVRSPRAPAQAWGAVGIESYQRAMDEHAIVSLADAKGTILAVNDKFCERSGYTRNELLGKTYRMVGSGHHGQAFFQGLWQTVLAGKVWKGEIHNRTKAGASYWVDSTLVPVPGPAGPTHFIAIQTEVTALHEAQEAERQSHKMEGLKAFAGGVAHDFSNLLTAILGNCNLGIRDVHPESRTRNQFDRIELAAMRGADLTNQLLAYLGQTAATLKTIDLNVTVEDAREFLQAMVPRGTRLEFHLDPRRPMILADASQLLQILRTLAVNAFEAMSPEAPGLVSVNTGLEVLDQGFAPPNIQDLAVPSGTYGFLEVRDEGGGMAPDVLRRAFDPFFTTKFIGRGLGLSALAGMVRNHHGTIRVRTEPGRGTSMKVLLPM